MDFTEDYVVACKACEPIQKLCQEMFDNRTVFDVFLQDEVNEATELLDPNGEQIFKIRPMLWIPRQDQLQDLLTVKYKETGLTGMIEDFIKEADSTYKENVWIDTMEKLWLCYVMKVEFNLYYNYELKIWMKIL